MSRARGGDSRTTNSRTAIATHRLLRRGGKLPPDVEAQLLGEALRGLANRYVTAAPTATFRFITSPLVTWIWLGAIIVFLGGLVAMWPGERDALRRRVRAGYAARVAKDLGRAPRGAQP